jgi:hypothetical protein
MFGSFGLRFLAKGDRWRRKEERRKGEREAINQANKAEPSNDVCLGNISGAGGMKLGSVNKCRQKGLNSGAGRGKVHPF